MVKTINCPNCNGSNEIVAGKHNIQCKFCDTMFSIPNADYIAPNIDLKGSDATKEQSKGAYNKQINKNNNGCLLVIIIAVLWIVVLGACSSILLKLGSGGNSDDGDVNTTKVQEKTTKIPSGYKCVPDVTYMGYADALEALSSAGFKKTDYTTPDGSTIILNDNWGVVSQNVAPGTYANPKNTIKLSCIRINSATSEEKNRAAFEVIMPDVVGKRYDYALIRLRELGFCDIKYTTTTGGSIVKMSNWEVVTQSVEAGVSASSKTTVTLKCKRIAGGNSDIEIEMPDLVGMNYAQAKTLLDNKGFNNIFPVGENGETVKKESNWEVISQNIEAGKRVSGVEDIKLVCKRVAGFGANDDVVMIDVVNMAYDVALEKLKAIGFTNISYETDTGETIKKQSNWGVISQNFAAGEIIKGGSSIHLVCTRIAGEPSTKSQSTTKASTEATVSATTKAATSDRQLAYKKNSNGYVIYYMIDFDANVVYYFTTGDTSYWKGTILSGNLNDGLKVDYYGMGVDTMHWKYVDHKTTLIVHDPNEVVVTLTNTSWDSARSLLNEKYEINAY